MSESEFLLQKDVEEVFALTPSDEAIASSREVIERYLNNNAALAGTIKWAEFSFIGKHIRSGISQAKSMSTRLISDWRDDRDIKELVSFAASGEIKAGLLVASANINEQYIWFVPYTPADPTAEQMTRLKAVVITQELIAQVIDMFNQEARITIAERRMIFQIVVGLHPKEAAIADGLSVETKRLHLKNACSKLNCSGQPELMRLVLGQMIHILYMCETETSHMQVIERFTSDFIGRSARLSVQRLSNGRLMRFWEFGPVDGRPLLMIHGILFPFLVLNCNDQLERHNIRLVVPVRAGFLDDQMSSELFYEGRLIDQTLEDLTAFVQQSWQKPIPVLGNATGGIFAMMMAQQDAGLFKNITVSSINLLAPNAGSDSFSSNFLGGIKKLAGNAGIFEWLAKQYLKTTFSGEKTTRFVLRRLFGDCATDLDVVNGVVGAGASFDWYRRLHSNSLLGIPSDFKLMADVAQSLIEDLRIPTTFLHGQNDAMTSIELVQELVSVNPAIHLQALPNCGHLAAASHPDMFWDSVAKAIE
ncbi:MAG: hypothetical protein P8J20_15705 [Novosphingobium sp.]|nr:hypothetical protein [Novosphingobium sp.]